MRRWLFVAALALLPSCKPADRPVCEVTHKGVHLYIEMNTEAYGDIVGALRAGLFDETIQLAASRGGSVSRQDGSQPKLCKAGQILPKSIVIAYSPRRDGEVGAVEELFFDESGQVKVAEFYVVPLMP